MRKALFVVAAASLMMLRRFTRHPVDRIDIGSAHEASTSGGITSSGRHGYGHGGQRFVRRDD